MTAFYVFIALVVIAALIRIQSIETKSTERTKKHDAKDGETSWWFGGDGGGDSSDSGGSSDGGGGSSTGF
jgi:uncharacterized membrane protein YgcG